jgi:hypothetical protein
VKIAKQLSFWILSVLIMTLIYQSLLGSFAGSLTLATLLLPGAAVMSFGFKQWRKNSKGLWRWIHLFYILLFSLYVEWVAMVVAYWLIFELQINAVPEVLVNPIFLWLYMLFFAMAEDRLVQGKRKVPIADVNQPRWFELISERKKVKIDLNKLQFVESKNEQTFFYLENIPLQSRERIGQIAERLPNDFLRVHRSFIVNPALALAIDSNHIEMKAGEIPVSRAYKKTVNSLMEKEVILLKAKRIKYL